MNNVVDEEGSSSEEGGDDSDHTPNNIQAQNIDHLFSMTNDETKNSST